MAWNRPILTDSGGFQVFSLSDLRKVTEDGVAFRSHLDGSSHLFTPESAIAAEIGLGADIIMAFDECTEHPADRARAQASMEMTLRWPKRGANCSRPIKKRCHGSGDPALREREASWGTGQSPLAKLGSLVRKERAEALASHQTASVAPGQTQALFGIVQGGTHLDLRRESADGRSRSTSPDTRLAG